MACVGKGGKGIIKNSLGKEQYLNEGEYKFIFYWEPPMVCLAWKMMKHS
jgi:hypothetical protein